ncbi:FHA domain-containing protein [Parabacteroides sp. OttesenSCG-928-G07]|nr:FHA domain-containing protein [Parabacteroides sp. OttesenSCG-928-G07]
MISINCPHCHIGLKVDEGKLPSDITSFKCPKCKQPISVSLLSKSPSSSNTDPETSLIQPVPKGIGRIIVCADALTKEQAFNLYEGVIIIGRHSNASKANFQIETSDRAMSREHIRIEIKKDAAGRYKHYLSDNNSKNHTLYNGSCLTDGEIVILKNNDEIVIGQTSLRFVE